MKCEWLILCSSVDKSRSEAGLSLIGVIGRVAVDTLPSETSPMVAAFRIVGVPNEQFELQIEVCGPDGDPLMGSPVLSHRLPGYGAWDSSLALGVLRVFAIGPHTVRLKVNRTVIGSVLLPVEQVVH